MNMFDVNNMIAILSNIGTILYGYTLEKSVEGIFHLVKKKLHKHPLEKMLFISIDHAFSNTYERYGWEYDQDRVMYEFMNNINDISLIHTGSELRKLFKKITCEPMKEEHINVWMDEFDKQITNPDTIHLLNYNNFKLLRALYNNQENEDILEEKLTYILSFHIQANGDVEPIKQTTQHQFIKWLSEDRTNFR